MLTFGLRSDREIYIQYVCEDWSGYCVIEWVPLNLGFEPRLHADGVGLRLVGTFPELLGIFSSDVYPSMRSVINVYKLLGTQKDIVSLVGSSIDDSLSAAELYYF
jgi:hypothetical protein